MTANHDRDGLSMTQETVMCPCCGDDMPRENVTCWTCYRQSDRHTVGVNSSGWVLTPGALESYRDARDTRMGGYR